jgi:hypothetical protein
VSGLATRGSAWPEPPSFEADVIGAAIERLGDVASIDRYGVESLQVGRRISYDVKAKLEADRRELH